jgi:hypothetical protein
VIPDWVAKLPKKSRDIFHFCLGRPYKVLEIDNNGFLVIDVSPEVDERFGGKFNDLRVEPKYVRRA